MYCDNARFGSKACTVLTKHNAASPASSHLAHPPHPLRLNVQGCSVFPSREVFEFLNHYLGLVLQRDFGGSEGVKNHADRLDAGGRNARRKKCSAIVSALRTVL